MSVPTAIIIVLDEVNLRRVLQSYADRSLNKDAPVTRPVQRTGSIKSHPDFTTTTPEPKFSVQTRI